MKLVLAIAVVVAACGDNAHAPADAPVAIDAPRVAMVAVSPASLDFGAVAIGGPLPHVAFTISNTGAAATPLAISVTGEFALGQGTCGSSLAAAGASCTVDVTAAPQSVGAKTGTLHVAAGTAMATAALAMTVTSDGGDFFSISPAVWSFGNEVVGQTSAAQTFTVTNHGGLTLAAMTIGLGGTDPDQFAIGADTCTGAMLPAGQTCTFAATFAPTASGAKQATISATATSTASVGVSGTAIAPALAIAPASHDFGSVGGGMTSAPFTFTISNSGTAAATPLTITTTGEFTKGASTCGASLAVGASCTVDVTAAPTTSGAKTGTLRAASGTVLATAALSATALTDGGVFISVNPSFWDFGSATVGQTTASQTFTVVENGAVTTSALAITKSGSDQTQFAIVADTCTGAMLANAQSCSFSVSFAPGSLGAKQATFSVSAAMGGTATVGVAGKGVAPAALTIAPMSHDYGTVGVFSGPHPTFTFTIANAGGIAAAPLALSVTGEFTISATTCTTSLAAGASCTADVTVAPQTIGAKAGELDAIAGSAMAAAFLSMNAISGFTGLSANPAMKDFGSVLVSGTSAAQTFTLTNTGATTTGAIALAINGINATEFAILSDLCTGKTLANGATCTLGVVFSPVNTGARSASLAATATPGGAIAVPLSGTGL